MGTGRDCIQRGPIKTEGAGIPRVDGDRSKTLTTVFVDHIPKRIVEGDIRRLLPESLIPEAVRIVRRPDVPDAFAFVQVRTAGEAQAIIQRLDRMQLENRILRAELARRSWNGLDTYREKASG